MKLSQFIKMCEDDYEIFTVYKMKDTIFQEVLEETTVKKYLELENKIDSEIIKWSMSVESYDYPILNIYIK